MDRGGPSFALGGAPLAVRICTYFDPECVCLCLSVCVPVCLSVCAFVCLLFVCLSVCLSGCLTVAFCFDLAFCLGNLPGVGNFATIYVYLVYIVLEPHRVSTSLLPNESDQMLSGCHVQSPCRHEGPSRPCQTQEQQM